MKSILMLLLIGASVASAQLGGPIGSPFGPGGAAPIGGIGGIGGPGFGSSSLNLGQLGQGIGAGLASLGAGLQYMNNPYQQLGLGQQPILGAGNLGGANLGGLGGIGGAVPQQFGGQQFGQQFGGLQLGGTGFGAHPLTQSALMGSIGQPFNTPAFTGFGSGFGGANSLATPNFSFGSTAGLAGIAQPAPVGGVAGLGGFGNIGGLNLGNLGGMQLQSPLLSSTPSFGGSPSFGGTPSFNIGQPANQFGGIPIAGNTAPQFGGPQFGR